MVSAQGRPGRWQSDLAPKASKCRGSVQSDLACPLPLAAAAMLLANDHWLKQAGLLPGWLTGKLSDFAGLFLAPIVVLALVQAAWPDLVARARRPLSWASVALVGLGFTLVKTWPVANALVGRAWGPMVRDPTDLLALPAALASGAWLLRRRLPPVRPRSPHLHLGALVVSALSCLATPAPRFWRNYPVWETGAPTERRLDCARARLWVSKAGKEGLGVTVAVQADGEAACRVRVERALLTVGDRRIAAAALPEPAAVAPGTTTYLYLPFAFDANAAWNHGQRDALLLVALAAGDATPVEQQIALAYRLHGFFAERPEWKARHP
jgi:hypothetical protein